MADPNLRDPNKKMTLAEYMNRANQGTGVSSTERDQIVAARSARQQFGTTDLDAASFPYVGTNITGEGGPGGLDKEIADFATKTFTPEEWAKKRQLIDIQSGLYSLGLPSDYVEQQRQKGLDASKRQAPELNLHNYSQTKSAQLRALDAMSGGRDGFISAGFEGQKAFNQSAQDAARQAARGGGLTNMADANQRNRNIAAGTGRQALSQDDATRNRLVQGAASGRAQDLQIYQAQLHSQLAQQGMNQAMLKFYLSQGMDYQEAQAQMQLEAAKIYAKRMGAGQGQQRALIGAGIQAIGTIAGIASRSGSSGE